LLERLILAAAAGRAVPRARPGATKIPLALGQGPVPSFAASSKPSSHPPGQGRDPRAQAPLRVTPLAGLSQRSQRGLNFNTRDLGALPLLSALSNLYWDSYQGKKPTLTVPRNRTRNALAVSARCSTQFCFLIKKPKPALDYIPLALISPGNYCPHPQHLQLH